MSYCRWSSMNYMCDLYVYEDVSGGWTTHIAGNRRIISPIPDIPFHRLPRFGAKWSDELKRFVYPSRLHALGGWLVFRLWAAWHKWAHQVSMDIIPSRPIGLRHDGETLSSDSAGECADLLEELRGIGYKVPQYAIDALREEQREIESDGPSHQPT